MNNPSQLDPRCSGSDRRRFLKQICAGTLATAAAPLLARAANVANASAVATPTKTIGTLPNGKIGNMEISRLTLGTNHITFFMHSRGLRYVDELARRYNTDEKIFETFATAEAHGINTFITHSDPKISKLFREYRDRRGGKLRWIVAPWIADDGSKATDVASYNRLVPQLAESGVDALYVPGMLTGPLVNQGKGALIADLLEVIKAADLPAGVAAHGLGVIQFCEKEKLPVDFYLKTFHHLNYPNAPKPEELAKLRQSGERYQTPWNFGDLKADYAEVPGFWCGNPEETAEFMKGVTKPWIAFKVMAAGAIPPRDSFRYAYSNGADFILAGMFDFQIAEDAKIAREAIAGAKNRPRPWCG